MSEREEDVGIPAADATRRGLGTGSANGSRAIEASEETAGALAPKPLRHEARVLVAETGFGVRHGIRLVLEDEGLAVCAEAEHAEAAIQAAVRERPAACLIDLRLPGGGLHAAEQICKRVPEAAVVMLADDVSDDELFDALRVGTSGFVYKNIDRGRLPHVVRGVLRGEAALPRELAGRLAQEFRDRGRRRYMAVPETRGVDLTMREWEILEFLRQGLTTRQVATRLGIAQVTVRRHVGELLKKLNVASRSEALELLEKRSVS